MKHYLKEIGKYKIEEIVGEGTFGKVFRGIDTSNSEQVALKFIEKKGKRPNELEELKKQTEMLQKMNHKNVIAMRDFLETQKQIVIVMEYAQTDLAKIMEKPKQKKRGLPYQQVKKFGKQILEALLHLRSHKIVHRDLKLQNILVHNDAIKLCDFGFAKMSSSTNFFNSIKGTPLYIAPQIIQRKAYNHKVDIWSFGIILFELFAGDPPFYANSFNNLIPKILNNKVSYPKDMPIQMRELLDGMLNKNPNLRYDWDVIKSHPFFHQPIPLRQIQNTQPNTFQQKLDSIQIKESKVIMKLDGHNQIEQILRIQTDLLNNKICGKQLRTSIIFYHKIITILGVACLQENKVPKQALLSIFKIITTLITKTKLDKKQAEDDITKSNEIVFAVVKLAQNQQDKDMLAQQFALLGYLLKNNFNNIQIDFDTQQEITSLIHESFTKGNLTPKLFSNSLKVLGILASQATCTLSNSQEFFFKIQQKKTIPLIAKQYSPNTESGILLQLLQKFVHPVINNLNSPVSHKTLLTFRKFRLQVSQILIQRDFICQKSPFEIFLKSNEIQSYIFILYELLKCSAKCRQLFMKYKYWGQLFSKKNLSIFYLAYNQIIIHYENINLLTKQFIQAEIMHESQNKLNDNKLTKVYLVSIAFFSIAKKPCSKQKTQMTKAIITQISQLLQTHQPLKTKACKQVEGSLSTNYSIFDDILARILCQIIQADNTDKESIINLCQKNIENCISINQYQKKCNLSEDTLNKLLHVAELYPSLKLNKKFLTTINSLFQHTIQQQYLSYVEQIYPKNIVQMLLLKYLSFVRITLNTDEKSSNSILAICEQNNLHQTLLSDNLMSTQMLPLSLNFLYRMLGKSQSNTSDYISLHGLAKFRKYLNLKNTSVEIIVQLVQLISTLARISKQYYKSVDETAIVQHIPQYLQSTQILIEKTLNFIGNLSKHSTYFFQQFSKFKIIESLQKCTLVHQSNKRILKNCIYAIGNISFYDERFNQFIQPLIPIFADCFYHCDDDHILLNIISTISNLLRHSGVYIKCLVETGIIKRAFEITIETSHIGNNSKILQCLSLIKKALGYAEVYNQKNFIELMRRIYQRKKQLGVEQHQCIRKIRHLLKIE